jgi:hypothetical protein
MLSNFEQFLSINCKAGYVFVMLYVLLKVNVSQVSPAILGERRKILNLYNYKDWKSEKTAP